MTARRRRRREDLCHAGVWPPRRSSALGKPSNTWPHTTGGLPSRSVQRSSGSTAAPGSRRSRWRSARDASTCRGADSSTSARGSARGPSSSAAVLGTAKHGPSCCVRRQGAPCGPWDHARTPAGVGRGSRRMGCAAGKGPRSRSRTVIRSACGSVSDRAQGAKTAWCPWPNAPWRGDGSPGRGRAPGPGCSPLETSRRRSRRPPSSRP